MILTLGGAKSDEVCFTIEALPETGDEPDDIDLDLDGTNKPHRPPTSTTPSSSGSGGGGGGGSAPPAGQAPTGVCPTDAAPFTDVPGDHWARWGINCFYGLELTTGTTATTFEPDQPVTRAQMAVFLARLWQTLG